MTEPDRSQKSAPCATRAVNALTKKTLFAGQSGAFFAAVTQLATAADAAMRGEVDDEHDS